MVQHAVQYKKGTDNEKGVRGKDLYDTRRTKSIASALAVSVPITDVVQLEDVDASWSQSMHSHLFSAWPKHFSERVP